mgnify:CR=1 FL=1
MPNIDENALKAHYICQTYLDKKGAQDGLQIGKQFQYATALQAQERAERESRALDCIGADAYMVIEDPTSGEVGIPSFLARIGRVPDYDNF